MPGEKLCAWLKNWLKLEVAARAARPGELLAVLLEDRAFYEASGGGVTLSGGEPLAQPAFARALLRACYERNVHTAVETTGCVAWQHYESALPYVDLFLFDLKHADDATHRRLTGQSNGLVLENLGRLAGAGASIVLRLPLVPEHNLDGAHLRAVADLAASLGAPEVHLMPFHQLGKDKYPRIGRAYTLGDLQDLRSTEAGANVILRAREIFERHGLVVHVGG